MALASQSLKYNYVDIQSPQSGTKPFDLTGHLEYIEYFENILSPTITMNIKLRSTYNFVSNLPIRGGEMIAIDLDTLLDKNFKFEINSVILRFIYFNWVRYNFFMANIS